MKRLIRSTGEGALCPARQYYVPGNEVRFFAACIFVRRTVIIGTLHEIDMRAHRYSRSDEGSLHVEIDAPAGGSASAGKANEAMHPSTSIWLKAPICPTRPMSFMAKLPQSPRPFDRASVFRGKLLA
jgi:hypothetical protein